MIAEQGSSLDSIETPVDSLETRSSGEVGAPARVNRLATSKRWTRRCLARWRLVLASALVIAAIGVPIGLFFVLYRPDQQIDDAAAHQVIQAASNGAVAALSYSYNDLDRDFAKAKSHFTGGFLDYYNKFTEQILKPTAQQGHLTATATVVRAAVSELHPDSAVVLIFMNQKTTSKEKPEPLTTASSVLVTLTKVNGSWLIAKLEPLS